MAEESKIESIVSEQKTRRTAIKTAAQVAVTAPAVGLLLSAGTKAAQAYVRWGTDDGYGTAPYTTTDDVADAGAGGIDNPIFLTNNDLYTF